MGINWKTLRAVFSILGIVIVCAVVMTTGTFAQLGTNTDNDGAARPSTEQDAAPSSSNAEPSSDDGREPFWDNVAASTMVKQDIDIAARDENCDKLNTLIDSYENSGVVLAGGVDADTDGEATSRAVIGYIANAAANAGCELD
jgi:hypothetical protein